MPPVEDVIGRTAARGVLTAAEVEEGIAEGLASLDLAGRRVLVLVPDGTRSMPIPLFFRILAKHLLPQARAVDFLVALGTHPPLSEDGLLRLFGLTRDERERHPNVRFLNHLWDDPHALAEIGTLSADDVRALSGSRLRHPVPVRLNRMVMEYDHLLVCGPVFPHEVAGFSGGNKYFFPGIAGADVIDFTHWLGALITTHDVIGRMDTPVRRAIDRAAAMIPVPRSAICAVIVDEGVAGVFVGPAETSWRQAAALSSERHVVWLDRPVRQVLSVLPTMYSELWVGAKGMYKTEPVVADGGEVILYAPHLRDVSSAHGAILRQVGYHVRDYFVAQWGRFRHLPWSVLAHSTHLKGSGAYSNGVEWPRIRVTLATGIAASECRALNLEYRDPRSLDLQSFMGREREGILYVPKAGESLYRLKDGA